MREQAIRQKNAQFQSSVYPASGILQRKCDSCDNHTMIGGKCAECGKRKGMLQRKLTIGASNDPLEQEADRVADQVTAVPAHSTVSGIPLRIQRYAGRATEDTGIAPASVDRALASLGQSLEPALLQDMERRFGHDFSHVRVHTDSVAAESAQAVNARAYTMGKNIVFGARQYAPNTSSGQRLLAHELTHVIQQCAGGNARVRGALDFPRSPTRMIKSTPFPSYLHNGIIQRQLITPLGAGGGFGGLMERDRRAASALAVTPFHVCSRDLQGALGLVGNHAYIEAPPYRYAIISPLCPASKWDNPITGTTAQKWDNSPDPCRKTPNCVPCEPKPGITDVATCFRTAFSAYNNPSLYRGLGPNSNTFAGTLARTCCANMLPKPPRLGNVPGWSDSPAPARAGATPCPPGPTC